ncbi:glycosyltransferase family 2 protein [Photobacterium damselae]|uniref:glycosyltransferase family 2 protein n=1 Tax=Photobacterium damselae TaxID=38293 RepID=UPI004069291C
MYVKVTCILFSYNQDRFIEKSLESMLNQDYLYSEFIIIDDGSNDSSVKRINKTIEKFHKKEVNFIAINKNKGLATAINTAVNQSNGEIIVFFAGDDISLPNRVSSIVAKWKETKASAIFSNAKMINEKEEELFILYDNEKNEDFHFSSFIKDETTPTVGATLSYHRDVFNLEYFNLLNSDVINEDRVLPLRALHLNGISYLQEPLVIRRHAIGLGTLNKGQLRNKVYKIMEVHYSRRISCLIQQGDDARKFGYSCECINLINKNIKLANFFEKISKKESFLSTSVLKELIQMGEVNKLFYWLKFRVKSYVKNIIR